ncbi:MAG TPA: hypothetical protein VIG76_08625 [Amnibacterium sp.]|jgi:hypothetical protein|uniref:hypothetical protein n=1 Tax=Amnibacterium sp. TaxID=1872496 RepID=UPI002F943B4E
MNDETQARMDSAMAALADYFRKPEAERRPGELGRLQAERDAAYQSSRNQKPAPPSGEGPSDQRPQPPKQTRPERLLE